MPWHFLSEQRVTGTPGSTTKDTCWVQQAGCSAEGAEQEPPKHRKQSRTCRPLGKSTRVRKRQGHSRQSGWREQGARHSTYTALLKKRSGVKGLSLNTALGEGLVAQVRLVRVIRACWCMQGTMIITDLFACFIITNAVLEEHVLCFWYLSGSWAFFLHCVKEELGPWNTNLFNRFSPCTAHLRCKGDTNIYVALDVHWWWKQNPGELITDDVGGYAKPGKKVFNISFGADGCLQQAYCHLGWGLFSEWGYLTHPNSLCFCQIKANQMTKTHPWSTWSDVADVALAEKK